MLLAVEWRLTKALDARMREAFLALREVIKGNLTDYCDNAHMQPSGLIGVWSTDFVREQESALSLSLILKDQSVSEAAMKALRSYRAVDKTLQSVRRADAHAVGMLLLGIERQALGMQQTVPHYPEDMPEQPAAVLALIDRLSENLRV
ncbi:unnamed protein product [Peniophora sp. CBMAI 1063]|nr:unnamed protein product [Peniophora sp. CBMAI 1063]